MYTNHLISEKSPYLLQHVHNPVDWYPWGEEAFEKAKKEDKPIFLSIGYSTCHWCHVMEKESFSDPEIAKTLNENFVSIKVDREERPDIDNIYMSAVVSITGSGGWPLTVFLTPEKEPFYGGTYFPPDDKWGRSGLKNLLLSVAQDWKERRIEILNRKDAVIHRIRAQSRPVGEIKPLAGETLKDAYVHLSRNFDPDHGGLGDAPKFPMAHSISFLMRYWKRTGESKPLEMAEKTLSKIFEGGIHDYIGGGFHRYSTDQRWHLPHFEKMLYDQAMLSRAYLEAYQATGKEEYAKAAKDIFEYVLHDMRNTEGAFYSAEDADSPAEASRPDEKEEGAFYVWTKEDIIDVLGSENGEIFCYRFGIESGGNVLQDPLGAFPEKNVL
ncbi:MAG: thioredoxin domain-containing protein, partial [Candidatus Omnitrophota bacterium]